MNKILETIQVEGDSVIVPLEDFYELLDHLGEPHGHPGLADRLKRALARRKQVEQVEFE